MATNSFTGSKTYNSTPFIITESKLCRIVEVAKERFERVRNNFEFIEEFEVSFKDGKRLKILSLKDLLSLDNSQKNPLAELRITHASKNENEPARYVQICYVDSERSSITLDVLSDDLTWMQETMGALEEQLERTISTEFVYAINKGSLPLFFGIFISMMVFLVSFTFTGGIQGPIKIQENRIAELASLSSAAKSDTEKLDFVFHYLSATLEKDSVSETLHRISKNPRTYWIGVPTLVGLLSALAAIGLFYPRHIFCWGDCREWYEKIIERRKILWYGVILSLITGVLAGVFVFGITS